ncbi:MAG: hypothetical protein M0Z46_16995 [Actinomycetota bacterium]|nr:hypothetical protein [Actinomycetota bacterium]
MSSTRVGNVAPIAAEEGLSVSAWMTAAARRALLLRDGLAAVAEWEQENGALTEDGVKAARHRLTEQLRSPVGRRSA